MSHLVNHNALNDVVRIFGFGGLPSCQNTIGNILQIVHGYHFAVFAQGIQHGFIQQILDLRSRKPPGHLHQRIQRNVPRNGFSVQMNVDNGPTGFRVGITNENIFVHATWSHERRVQEIHTVGRTNHKNTVGMLEPVQINQQLVQCLILLWIGTHHVVTTFASQRINLVNENNTRLVFFGQFEQLAYACGADPHIFLGKFATRNRDKRHVELPTEPFGHQGFTVAWRTLENDTFGSTHIVLAVLFVMHENVGSLKELLFNFIVPAYIIKGIRRLLDDLEIAVSAKFVRIFPTHSVGRTVPPRGNGEHMWIFVAKHAHLINKSELRLFIFVLSF